MIDLTSPIDPRLHTAKQTNEQTGQVAKHCPPDPERNSENSEPTSEERKQT
jgi:hypothetical protein